MNSVSENIKGSQIVNSELTVDGMPKKYQMRNFLLIMTQAAIFSLGWAMPSVVRIPFFNWLQLKESTIGIIGSVAPLSLIGLMFIPLISRRFKRKKFLSFFLAIPYLWADLAVGIGIVMAMYSGNATWLLPMTVICYMAWPFFGGWGTVPYQEYTANCISKERIGTFVGASQFVGPLLGLVGSAAMTYLMTRVDAPFRYAIAFIIAYVLAQAAGVLALFAHETSSPSPPREQFWRPAFDAFVTDKIFRKLLLIAFLSNLLLWFTYTFIPLMAIREWGLPDWVAAMYFTVLMGAKTVGGLIATGFGQKIGYSRTIKIALAVLLISLVPLVIPEMGAGKADRYKGQWIISENQSIENNYIESNVLPNDQTAFCIVNHIPHTVNNIIDRVEVQFSHSVDKSTFNVYDVVITGPDGRRIKIKEAVESDAMENKWDLIFEQPKSALGTYDLMVRPYISDVDGNAMDQNGDGKVGYGHWMFFIQAVIYGIAYTLVGACLMSLMYILAPDNRRSGYFAATNILLQLTPGIAVFASGLAFVPGRYRLVYSFVLLIGIPIALFCCKLLKPLVVMEQEKRVMNQEGN